MIATDELTNGQLIDLPAEAGEVNEPRFEPRDDWLRTAGTGLVASLAWASCASRPTGAAVSSGSSRLDARAPAACPSEQQLFARLNGDSIGGSGWIFSSGHVGPRKPTHQTSSCIHHSGRRHRRVAVWLIASAAMVRRSLNGGRYPCPSGALPRAHETASTMTYCKYELHSFSPQLVGSKTGQPYSDQS